MQIFGRVEEVRTLFTDVQNLCGSQSKQSEHLWSDGPGRATVWLWRKPDQRHVDASREHEAPWRSAAMIYGQYVTHAQPYGVRGRLIWTTQNVLVGGR